MWKVKLVKTILILSVFLLMGCDVKFQTGVKFDYGLYAYLGEITGEMEVIPLTEEELKQFE